ncbi:hypothetical protein N008_21810 (plasmid) [Hymenobacter sp. APR13]|nr:hypothetical protein N008_21810 [Hymenobacter sp. APR13]
MLIMLNVRPAFFYEFLYIACTQIKVLPKLVIT